MRKNAETQGARGKKHITNNVKRPISSHAWWALNLSSASHLHLQLWANADYVHSFFCVNVAYAQPCPFMVTLRLGTSRTSAVISGARELLVCVVRRKGLGVGALLVSNETSCFALCISVSSIVVSFSWH